jgi:hypothetical protein
MSRSNSSARRASSDHALHPEDRRETRAARDGHHAVATAGRIEHHVAGRELDRLRPVDVLDHKFAAFVGVGRGEEQRGRDIGANLHAGAGQQPDRAVDVRAELHFGGAVVAVEHRRIDPRG